MPSTNKYEYEGRVYEEFTDIGSDLWVAPAGVTFVDVVCVGGGGSGGAAYWSGGGGGGGGLGWRKNISVIPGQSYVIAVGAGGVGRTANAGGSGNSGSPSYFIDTNTVSGGGGGGGGGTSSNTNTSYSGGGGGNFRGDGGGLGGSGGNSNGDTAGGGGGAGGWSGTGGNGGSGNTSGTAGAGGSGGGGGAGGNNGPNGAAPSGGGVGVNAAFWYSTQSGIASGYGAAGRGGSGGTDGSMDGTNGGSNWTGGRYGGGGGGQSNDTKNTPACNGGQGVVVISYLAKAVRTLNEQATPSTIHTQEVVFTADIVNTTDHLSAYRVFVGANQVFPVEGWSEFMSGDYSISITISGSSFYPGSNVIKVETKDSNDTVYGMSVGVVVAFSNENPQLILTSNSPIHRNNALVTGSVIDADGDMVRYRVLIDGEEKFGWSGYRQVPFTFTAIIPNAELLLGDAEVTVEIEDNYHIKGTGTATLTISKVNHQPRVDNLRIEGHIVKGVIADEDSDRVQFRISIDGQHIYPSTTNGYTELLPTPIGLWIDIPPNNVQIGQQSSLRIDMTDELGAFTTSIIEQTLDYAGIMFHDELGSYYADNLGNVLKYLVISGVVAGNQSNIYRVWLKNTIGYELKNIRLNVNQRELDGTTVWAEISSSNEPFQASSEVAFPDVLAHGDSLAFYVRLGTTIEAYGKGLFDVIVEADPT